MRERIRSRLRGRGWHSLLPETRRGLLALLGALVAGPLIALAVVPASSFAELDVTLELAVIGLAGYLLVYVALTALAFWRSSWRRIEAWAGRRQPTPWYLQLLTASSPGPGVASSVSLIALVAAVVWLPRQRSGEGVLAGPAVFGLAVVLVVGSWVAVVLTYAVAYLLTDLRSGQRALSFPGGQDRSVLDYLYLAVATSTTLGSSDVQLLTREARSLWAGHAVLAFVFNAVILAAVVSVLVTWTG